MFSKSTVIQNYIVQHFSYFFQQNIEINVFGLGRWRWRLQYIFDQIVISGPKIQIKNKKFSSFQRVYFLRWKNEETINTPEWKLYNFLKINVKISWFWALTFLRSGDGGGGNTQWVFCSKDISDQNNSIFFHTKDGKFISSLWTFSFLEEGGWDKEKIFPDFLFFIFFNFLWKLSSGPHDFLVINGSTVHTLQKYSLAWLQPTSIFKFEDLDKCNIVHWKLRFSNSYFFVQVTLSWNLIKFMESSCYKDSNDICNICFNLF